MSAARCLIVSDGRRGIENQALGLGEALARQSPVELDIVQIKQGQTPDLSETLDIWIGCGRAAVNAAPAYRKAFPKAVFAYVQDPKRHHHLFDLIIPPRHDGLTGDNVFPILGSTNRITDALLDSARAEFSARLSKLTGKTAAFLIGGHSKRHTMDEARCAYILDRIEHVRAQGLGLMITDSRRTPAKFRALLKERYQDADNVWLHDENEPNPYFAFLGAADWLFVTEDSTNMLTEAAATGKPVYRLTMDGKPGKFRALYGGLEGHGAMRPYLGQLEHWNYTPLHETAKAADALLEIVNAKAEL